MIAGASEGGAAVFKLQCARAHPHALHLTLNFTFIDACFSRYFQQQACLAQSPQLYKQMTAACSDLERVFEIGPVFRAENSNTHRHLCEFHGLDLEMVIDEHYYEVLKVFSDLFVFIFRGLNERFAREIEAVRAQHPFADLVFTDPTVRISYAEGIEMLQASGVPSPWATTSARRRSARSARSSRPSSTRTSS